MLNFQHKNGCKGHQRSSMEWQYIKIDFTRSTVCVETFMFVKQHRVATMSLYCTTPVNKLDFF